MQPRFVGRLGIADAVTVANAAVGFLAVAGAMTDPGFGARLILLAAVADGLDGVLARWAGSTPAGEYLDSLADVASFGVAPAVLVYAVALEDLPIASGNVSLPAVAALGVPAVFVAMAVTRLGLYTAYDAGDDHTEGVPSTLAATILAAAVLAEVGDASSLIAATGVFSYLMVTTVEYPDLIAQDALIMGVVHSLAVLAPNALGRAFPYALLFLALAYLAFAPRFYWGSREGKRS